VLLQVPAQSLLLILMYSHVHLCGAFCKVFHTTALQEHVIELGKLALDCLIISELDLGRVCHCLGEPRIGCAVTGT
jgi:hypothetical protein